MSTCNRSTQLWLSSPLPLFPKPILNMFSNTLSRKKKGPALDEPLVLKQDNISEKEWQQCMNYIKVHGLQKLRYTSSFHYRSRTFGAIPGEIFTRNITYLFSKLTTIELINANLSEFHGWKIGEVLKSCYTLSLIK